MELRRRGVMVSRGAPGADGAARCEFKATFKGSARYRSYISPASVARVRTFLLSHRHQPRDCRIAVAAWKGFDSPLRGGRPLGSCVSGGHGVWWLVQAADAGAALAQLPPYVAARTVVEEVRAVPLP